MAKIINKSARFIFFGEVIAAPDAVTIYEISDSFDLTDLIEAGDIEVQDVKKTSVKPKE